MDKYICYNEDCLKTMQDHIEPNSVDLVLTSPPYNTNMRAVGTRTLTQKDIEWGGSNRKTPDVRYDVYSDGMSNDEYCQFTESVFNGFSKILKQNGVVLYNLSYSVENSIVMFQTVNHIVNTTEFALADIIIWKKHCASPENTTPNRLTRIVEFVFVFCRKSEITTYHCNKKISSQRDTGQVMYSPIYNFIEAANNDGVCPYNRATYSTELCEKLLRIYAPKSAMVYDPFMGTGTTAIACDNLGFDCIGSELSENQIAWASERFNLNKHHIKMSLDKPTLGNKLF